MTNENVTLPEETISGEAKVNKSFKVFEKHIRQYALLPQLFRDDISEKIREYFATLTEEGYQKAREMYALNNYNNGEAELYH